MKLADIQLDSAIYPREGQDNDVVASYRNAIDRLPPILVTHEGWLVDGYHRYLAHVAEGLQEIEAEVIELPKERVLIEAVRRNALHGKQLELKEKRELAQRLYGTVSMEELADLLSVTKRSVMNWTAEQRAEEHEKQLKRVWEAWLACKSTRAIAEEEKIDPATVINWIDELVKNGKFSNSHQPPDSFQQYDIWRFKKCDECYGNPNFPGRIPGQIIENLLWYYTEPGDVVLDPMAGGGTTVDVCKAMGRRYVAYDLRPSRADIQQHDAKETFPLPDSIRYSGVSVKLAFLDPPYWKQKSDKYEEGGIGSGDVESFYQDMIAVIGNCAGVIESGYIALIIGPTQEDQEVTDHAADLLRLIQLPLARRFIIPYQTQQHGGAYVIRAKENRYPLYLFRDLIVWRTEPGKKEANAE